MQTTLASVARRSAEDSPSTHSLDLDQALRQPLSYENRLEAENLGLRVAASYLDQHATSWRIRGQGDSWDASPEKPEEFSLGIYFFGTLEQTQAFLKMVEEQGILQNFQQV